MAQVSLLTRKSTLRRQQSCNRKVSNKKADLLRVAPKGQPEGLSVMVVDEDQKDMLH